MADGASVTPIVTMQIAGEEVGSEFIDFTWRAFVNSGYIIRVKCHDPYLKLYQRLIKSGHLKQARQEPLVVTFKIGWGLPGKETPMVKAIVTDLEVEGAADRAAFDFVAIDPPSWYLNAGNGSGKVYKGRVSDVIKQVVQEYAPGISIEVTKTNDDPNGTWGMMRQDPKTFIQSLLDWSASITAKKTHWMVASHDDSMLIKEQHDFPSEVLAEKLTATVGKQLNQLLEFQLLSNNSVTLVQTRLVTQGISSVSGKYIDRRTSLDKVEVKDENTANKVNSNIDSRRGYSKPNKEWSTSIVAVPELSGGELGIKYEDYIDGRARNLYLSMLPMVMRMRWRMMGDHRFFDGSKLGTSTVNIEWKDSISLEDFFLSGKWLVYGWVHEANRSGWTTDLYLYRIDHDAAAKKV